MKLKLKFSKQWCGAFLLLLPFVEPHYFKQIGIIHRLYMYSAYIVLFILAFFWLSSLSKNKSFANRHYLLLVTYIVIIFVSCLINKTPIQKFILDYVPILGISTWIDYYIDKSIQKTLKCLVVMAYLFTIINFATIVFFPNGLYKTMTEKGSYYLCWFLGYKNPQIRFFLPAIGFVLVSDFTEKGTLGIKSLFYIAIVVLSESKLNSATSLIGLAIFALLYVIFGRRERLHKYFEVLKLKYFYIGCAVITILVVLFSFQQYFAYLIENVLNRELDLTNRTIIWGKVLMCIADKPILGYGLQDSAVAESYIWAPHAHNYFLQQIYVGGLIAFVVITIYWFGLSRNCEKYFNLKSTKVLMFISISMLVMGITEALTEAPLFYPLTIMMSELYYFSEPEVSRKILIIRR